MNMIVKNIFRIIPLLFIAGIAGAYTPPTSTAPGNNTYGPLTIGDTYDVKTGGLTVGTFQTRNTANFLQDVYIGSQINGGHPSDNSSTVAIGSATTTTDLVVTGNITTASAQSDTLASGGGKKNVCANNDGTYILCATPVVSCVINSFTSSSYTVKSNASSPLTFTWSTTGCDSASINGVALSNVNGSGSYPANTGTYTLTASNTTNSTTKSFTINQASTPTPSSMIALYPSEIAFTVSSIDGPVDTFYKAHHGKLELVPLYTVTQGTPAIVLEFCGTPAPGSAACVNQSPTLIPPPDSANVLHGDYQVIYSGLCQGPSQGSPKLRYRNSNGTEGALVGSTMTISGAVNLVGSCN